MCGLRYKQTPSDRTGFWRLCRQNPVRSEILSCSIKPRAALNSLTLVSIALGYVVERLRRKYLGQRFR